MARYKARILMTGLVVGGNHGKVLIAPWQGPRVSSYGLPRISVQGGTSTNVALGDERKFFPVVLTTGPEEILCSGRVGSRAPISPPLPLPLLGPAAPGSVGSLRRMSQGRRSRCETGKLTSQPARWGAHNSTEVLEPATTH
jgi:hypothetical protein